MSFPLVEDAEVKQYLDKVMSKVPNKDVTMVHRDGRVFVIGPASELPLLFPETKPIAK
jgi:hypothetical protein